MFLKPILVLLFVLLFSSFARAQDLPPPPDVAGWIMEKNAIDVKISDEITVYIGFELKYQNPTDPQEFVMVIMRSIPAIVVRSQVTNDRSFIQTFVENYANKDEKDLLKILYEERSDPVIYIKWRVKDDPRTGKVVQDGDATVWLETNAGERLTSTGEKVSVEFMTELIVNGEEKNISVGRKYSLKNGSQILKIDRGDLEAIFVKGDKK